MGPKKMEESWALMGFLQGARKSYDGTVSSEVELYYFTLQLNVLFVHIRMNVSFSFENRCFSNFEFNLVSI